MAEFNIIYDEYISQPEDVHYSTEFFHSLGFQLNEASTACDITVWV